MTENKFSCIYADPPWKMKAGRPFGKYKKEEGKQVFNFSSNTARELPYPAMTIDEICALNVKSLSADNCHLYMWVPNKYLLEAGKVLDAWGFKYSTTLTWIKKPMGGGLGGTFRITTEFMIFATKGKVNSKRHVIGTWFDFKREYKNGFPCHSKKPHPFYGLIESVSYGPYLELFAREQREGWSVFGNEVANSIKF